MRVLGKDKIAKYQKKHSDTRHTLSAWLFETQSAVWTKPQDIKDRYNSVDFLPKNRVIFNIKGNHHRLVVKVKYQKEIVLIEWIGTHSEYDKKTF